MNGSIDILRIIYDYMIYMFVYNIHLYDILYITYLLRFIHNIYIYAVPTMYIHIW